MSYSETVTKEDLKNILNEVLPFGWEVQYGSPTEITSATLISGYTATANGMFIFRVAEKTGGATGYYYVQDTTTSRYVYQAQFVAQGMSQCAGTPMIKGHTYKLLGQSEVDYSTIIALPFVATALSNSAMDYIVEQGTSGIWTYRKWNSGVSECWGSVDTSTSFAVWTAPIYYGSTYSANQTYPTNLFIEKPVLNVSMSMYGSDVWHCPLSSALPTTANTGRYYPVRVGTGSSGTFITNFYAIGKWK